MTGPTDRDLLNPSLERREHLVSDLTRLFLSHPTVRRVLTFGSASRGEADRWSDIDLLLVVDGHSEAYYVLLASLEIRIPILHRSALRQNIDPAGGNFLGIVFNTESVFHKLDLNFIHPDDFKIASNLRRFGPLAILRPGGEPGGPPTQPSRETMEKLQSDDTVDRSLERHVWMAMHSLHGSAKDALRGVGSLNRVTQNATRLRDVFDRISADELLAGNIRSLARRWLEIADCLIDRISYR